MTRIIIALLVLLGSLIAQAKAPADLSEDAKVRAAGLAAELRCLVCQNQTIADSNAELAVDLRRQIHEQIAAGKSNSQIVDFMVTRYGDFVLYRPPFKATTVLLWIGPGLFAIGGLIVLWRLLRARRVRLQRELPLSEEQRRQAARLLDDGAG